MVVYPWTLLSPVGICGPFYGQKNGYVMDFLNFTELLLIFT
jgi:uncharacterized membrane protein